MPRTSANRSRHGLLPVLAVAAIAGAATAVAATTPPSAKLHLGVVGVSGSTVSVNGTVALTPNTAAVRRHAAVQITLGGASGGPEMQTVKLTAKDAFSARVTTTLTGSVIVTAQAELQGKPSGASVTRPVTVTPPAGSTMGQALIGTFKLEPGSAPAGQAPAGSYFEMLTSSGSPLGNASSPAGNKDYTPLTPGTDGGLETTGYQPSPSPAFSGGAASGGSVASRIMKPVPFYGVNFSVVTNPTDPQTHTSDPVPVITDTNGVLSGQVTAWAAQWNGQSFNQGSPKPGGTLPAPTTPVSGTYDAATGQFTLQWKSRIVGGPFNSFTGLWHLTGTFVPAAG